MNILELAKESGLIEAIDDHWLECGYYKPALQAFAQAVIEDYKAGLVPVKVEMTRQRESFEKWWNETKGDEITDVGLSTFTEEVMFASWQAAQTDQAKYMSLLELNNKFKYNAIALLQAKLDTILITAEALANEVRMSQPQRDVMAGFVAGVKEVLAVNVLD